MKPYWKLFKLGLAWIILIATIFWVVDSVRSRTYGGTNINATVGIGAVTVINPATEPITVQLVGMGTRSFSVLSTSSGISGSSTGQGDDSVATQLLALDLPSGVSEFEVEGGNSVRLVAVTDTNLIVNVEPLNASTARTTLITALVVILSTLFYISRRNNHHWVNKLLGRRLSSVEKLQPVFENTAENQDRDIRSYGDNHIESSV